MVAKLPSSELHYVSLGSGTGQKDRTVVNSLLKKQPHLRYFPVEMTSEMLRLSVSHVLENARAQKSHVFPIQIDFAEETNLIALRGMIDNLVGEEPILFSLFGNTLANFKDDSSLLSSITSHLLRDKDVLLLEIAWTHSIEKKYEDAARREYENAEAFRHFAVSSLLQNTDLDIDDRQLLFHSNIENDERAITIKAIYTNNSEDKDVQIIGGNKFKFEEGDTIRLYLSRKYTDKGIKKLTASSHLNCCHEESSYYRDRALGCRFGVKLLVLQKEAST